MLLVKIKQKRGVCVKKDIIHSEFQIRSTFFFLCSHSVRMYKNIPLYHMAIYAR